MLETLRRGAGQLGISLTAPQIEQFQVYYEELLSWNEKANLTSITDYDGVQTRHFLDSLSIVPLLRNEAWPQRKFSLVDVGTGAGLPGIPLKIMLPDMRVVLMESVGKKTAFLNHIVETLALSDTEVVTARAEDTAHRPEYREKFDLVVARAVGKLSTLAELTLPFCDQGGLVVAQKKGDIAVELDRAARAIEVLGGKLKTAVDVTVEGLEHHLLVVMEKVATTPTRYPRRAGIPAKRPL